MKKVLFIDRDGTLIKEPPVDLQVDSLEKLVFLPGIFRALYQIVRYTDYELVMVTNQDGLGTGSFPESSFWPAHNKLMLCLENEGIRFDQVFIDKSFEKDGLPTRKPGTAMLAAYLTGDYDLKNSWVIGDRETDIQLARNLGTGSILLSSGAEQVHAIQGNDYLVAHSWEDIFTLVAMGKRQASVLRKTGETEIGIELMLDGSGTGKLETGLGFFDHMLNQIARHSGCNLSVVTKGDLHVDEHHTIEDTALALGEAFRLALGEKRGLSRYGFALPMDDCAAQVLIDFGGRPWLVWNAVFNREKIGELPTEMFFHFFKSFSDAARCNLHIEATGSNEHHKIEAIFKALGRALKMAIRRDATESGLPTTKGIL